MDLLDILEIQFKEWFPNVKIALSTNGYYKDLLVFSYPTMLNWDIWLTQRPRQDWITYSDKYGTLEFTGHFVPSNPDFNPSNPKFLNNLRNRMNRVVKEWT